MPTVMSRNSASGPLAAVAIWPIASALPPSRAGGALVDAATPAGSVMTTRSVAAVVPAKMAPPALPLRSKPCACWPLTAAASVAATVSRSDIVPGRVVLTAVSRPESAPLSMVAGWSLPTQLTATVPAVGGVAGRPDGLQLQRCGPR